MLAYAREKNLEWIEDSSNTDLRFTRNDLRHRILPAIESRFPAVCMTLARSASHFREAAGLLDELAQADAAAVACENGKAGEGGHRAFNRASLLGLSPARLANLFRWELRRLGSLPPTTARLAEALRQLRTASGPLRLPLGDCTCYSRRGRVWLSPERRG
jgi:tRNA(Ile)-lysidine synthase